MERIYVTKLNVNLLDRLNRIDSKKIFTNNRLNSEFNIIGFRDLSVKEKENIEKMLWCKLEEGILDENGVHKSIY